MCIDRFMLLQNKKSKRQYLATTMLGSWMIDIHLVFTLLYDEDRDTVLYTRELEPGQSSYSKS